MVVMSWQRGQVHHARWAVRIGVRPGAALRWPGLLKYTGQSRPVPTCTAGASPSGHDLAVIGLASRMASPSTSRARCCSRPVRCSSSTSQPTYGVLDSACAPIVAVAAPPAAAALRGHGPRAGGRGLGPLVAARVFLDRAVVGLLRPDPAAASALGSLGGAGLLSPATVAGISRSAWPRTASDAQAGGRVGPAAGEAAGAAAGAAVRRPGRCCGVGRPASRLSRPRTARRGGEPARNGCAFARQPVRRGRPACSVIVQVGLAMTLGLGCARRRPCRCPRSRKTSGRGAARDARTAGRAGRGRGPPAGWRGTGPGAGLADPQGRWPTVSPMAAYGPAWISMIGRCCPLVNPAADRPTSGGDHQRDQARPRRQPPPGRAATPDQSPNLEITEQPASVRGMPGRAAVDGRLGREWVGMYGGEFQCRALACRVTFRSAPGPADRRRDDHRCW